MRGRMWLSLTGMLGAIVFLVQCSSPESDSGSGAEASAVAAQMQKQKGGQDEFGPYEPVENWPQPLPGSCEAGYTWGSTPGIFAETPNKVWIIQRGENPLEGKLKCGQPSWTIGLVSSGQWEKARKKNFVFTVDADGKLLKLYQAIDAWFAKSGHPHKIATNPYDPQKPVWIVDNEDHQVLKWTNDGSKLLLALGEKGKSGDDTAHFNQPTDIAFLPDGTFFVSDGYFNTRVMKFDKDGKLLLSFGQKGTNPYGEEGPEGEGNPIETRPGYMNLVHSVAVGPNGRVYVADRGNGRIQVFDQNGKYLDEWKTRMPYFILTTQDAVWVSDGYYQKIAKYDFDGYFQYSWGTSAGSRGRGFANDPCGPGCLLGVHGMSVDTAGNFYTAEVSHGRAQKFRPKQGVDPAKLVGKPLGAATN